MVFYWADLKADWWVAWWAETSGVCSAVTRAGERDESTAAMTGAPAVVSKVALTAFCSVGY